MERASFLTQQFEVQPAKLETGQFESCVTQKTNCKPKLYLSMWTKRMSHEFCQDLTNFEILNSVSIVAPIKNDMVLSSRNVSSSTTSTFSSHHSPKNPGINSLNLLAFSNTAMEMKKNDPLPLFSIGTF